MTRQMTQKIDLHMHSRASDGEFEPEELFSAIRKRIPGLKVRYQVDPVRQAIAGSWPDKMDDICARKEWGWSNRYGMDDMVDDMIKNLRLKLEDTGQEQ